MGESEAENGDDLFPKSVGERLRDARVKQGLDIDDIASRTRIPRRHLEAIEESDYSRLPSTTYAMGFAKAHARVVGLDEAAVGRDLRAELDTGYEREAPHIPYDVSDPDRVPSGGIAMISAIIAVLVLIGAGIWYGTDWFRGDEAEPPAQVAQTQTPQQQQQPTAPAPTPTPQTGGQVTLTATGPVWIRVYDADNKTLVMKTLQQGESYNVPQDANQPMINVGRPGELKVTINGSEVAPLGPPERAIKDVGVSADALRARGSSDTQTSATTGT
ncbi:helix-turn-helix domain-containing protein [Stakelama marina]|uniref:Helix-turn-helix domain-containing protein n=1 Tax=Stakelama marina TaxID=2826939 RepID=A0A8T4III9_9SPHN|nr:helix-turn-helix domain-containing protein [Stakelama marina]MBR0552915.1 helix-turn-helix domain-containing protein [Stakelama marina]